jgi:hypothetical protein
MRNLFIVLLSPVWLSLGAIGFLIGFISVFVGGGFFHAIKICESFKEVE